MLRCFCHIEYPAAHPADTAVLLHLLVISVGSIVVGPVTDRSRCHIFRDAIRRHTPEGMIIHHVDSTAGYLNMNTGTGIASDLRLQILCILSCRHISRGIRFIFHIDFPCRLLSRERSDLLLCCRTHISGRQQPDLLFLLRQHHRNLDHRTILLKSILHIDHRSFSHTVIAIELVLSCRLVEDFRHLTGTLPQ